jgi:hypothetical protein
LKKIPVTAAALSVALLLACAPDASAAKATPTKAEPKTTKTTTKKPVVHTLANLPAVKISAKSSVSLTDINIMTQDNESILTYTLTIRNGDSKTLNLVDYWSKVKTSGGTTYSTTLMSKDKDKKKVAAGASTTLTYVATVAKNTKPQDLIFQVVKWDFSQTGYEALKGQFKIPASYVTATPAGGALTLRVTDIPVKARVRQIASFKSGDYNYVSVGLNLTNGGYRIFEDPKLKFVIKTGDGVSYPLSADPTSVEYKIQPQDNKTLNLMTAIPKSINLNKMELQVLQDDETAKITLPIGTIQMPNATNKSLATEPNQDATVQIGNGKVEVSVTGMTTNQSFDEHNVSIRVRILNSSGKVVTLPKYQFELQTTDGYRLPISTTALDNAKMQPLEEKNVTLTTTIPANVSAESPQLFMSVPSAEDSKDNFNYPVAIFNMPEGVPAQNTIGEKQFVQTNQGLVGFSLDSLQRLPWTDGDLVVAKVTIRNPNMKTMLVPELLGELKIDSAKLTSDTKLVSAQAGRLLGGLTSTEVYAVAKVPSFLDFQQVQVSLLEKVGESSSEWMQFSYAGKLPSLPVITKDKSYKLESSGRTQDFRVHRSFVYSGTSSDIIYTELEATNLEDRQLDLSQITGAYQASGGQTYKATAKQIETSTGPEEKSIITLWAKIPKKISTTDMKLVIGEGIADNKLAPVKGDITGYVNAAAMELNVVQPSVKGNLSSLDMFPYTLNVKNVRATLSGSTSVSLVFDYSQTRNMDYAIGEFEHKYLIEVVDSTGRTFEKEFTPETDLKVSNGASASFSFDDAVFENRRGGSFTFNVYDLFQGQKVKLGGQGFYYMNSNFMDRQ